MYLTYKRFIRSILFIVVAINAYLPNSYAQTMETKKFKPASDELRQFIEPIFLTHPQLLAAKAELDAVKSQYTAATQAIYNPQLELDTEKITVRTSTIGLSQTIDWGDQQGANTQIARQKLIAAQATFQQQRQQLIRQLLNVLIDYRNKSRLAELSQQRLNLMKDFYAVAKKKHVAGDLNQVELDLAQLAYSESVLNNARIMAEQVNAEQTYYAFYSRQSAATKRSAPELTYVFQPVSLPLNLNAFLLTLPQMRALRANVKASKNTIALREGQSSADPTIAIRGGKEDKESLVGLSISIPLNVRNSFRAEIEVARKEYLRAEQLAQQTYRNLQGRIHSQTRRYQLMQQAWQLWKSAGQVSMDRQLKMLKRLWQAGDLSTTDYLVQIKQNLNTQSAGIELNSTLWGSWLAWLDTTAQIESWLQLKPVTQPGS